MSKDPEPYRCDAPGCAKRRSNDANHWWLIHRGEQDGVEFIVIHPWKAANADLAGIKHTCGIDCMTKVAANAAAEIVDRSRDSSSTGKKVADGA